MHVLCVCVCVYFVCVTLCVHVLCVCVYVCVYCSYLKSLTPMFGECVDKFLDKLRPLADGRTQVPMKKHIHNAALDVISKVLVCNKLHLITRGLIILCLYN